MLELFPKNYVRLTNNTNDNIEGLVDIIEELVLQTKFESYKMMLSPEYGGKIIEYIDITEPRLLTPLAQWPKSQGKYLKGELRGMIFQRRYSTLENVGNTLKTIIDVETYLTEITSYEAILQRIYGDTRYKGTYTPPDFTVLKKLDVTDSAEIKCFNKEYENLARWMHTGKNAVSKYVWDHVEERFEKSEDHPDLYTKQRYFYTEPHRCYMVTACTKNQGLLDTCEELETMRWYRDTILVNMSQGEKLIKDYYDLAPEVVRRVLACSERDELLLHAYKNEVVPIVTMIQQQKYEQVQQRLFQVMKDLHKLRFCN